MTENEIKRFNGKRVRFKKTAHKAGDDESVFEGYLSIAEDPCFNIEEGEYHMRIGFYLETIDLSSMLYFDHRAIATITEMEEIEYEA